MLRGSRLTLCLILEDLFPFLLCSSLSPLVFPYTCSRITIVFYLLFQVINIHMIWTASIYDKTLSFLSLLPFQFFCFVSEMVKFPACIFCLENNLGFQRRAAAPQNYWLEIVMGVSWVLDWIVLLNPHLMMSRSFSSKLSL